MNNEYITESILAQQTGGLTKLSAADFKELTERQQHVEVSIADRQRQLEAVVAMEEWYRQNAQATAALEDATTHSNQVSKQYLALRGEEMKLELFDSVHEFRSYYEQICERRRVIDGIKQQESEVAQAIEGSRSRLSDIDRQLAVARERQADAEEQLHHQQPVIDHGYVLDGEIKTLIAALIAAEDALADAQQQQGESEADYRTRQNELAHVKEQVEADNLHYQALAVHQLLFEQYQAVSEKLQLYNSEAKTNDEAHRLFTDNNLRHSNLLVQHDKVKKQLQSARERLEALQADRKVHETAIEEMDSVQLYHRYAASQQRLVQLQSARQAWQTIAAGYDAIENHRAAIERLSRQVEQKQQDQAVAERDVRRLFERYNRLSKAFVLLQIENTRKLRESLKEGTPCPVCGSAHHPYHTEVEQELGETQTQLERDYIEAKREYEERQVTAAEVVAEAQKCAGQLEAERAVLERMQGLQKTLEEDWERFRRLDSSFVICSSSVNRDARRTTIEMLIDSAKRHIEEYEQQIARFDFHTAQLHEIVAKAEAEEHTVDALRQQYWQLDTELQIVTERVETQRTLMSKSDARIEHLYKDLDDVVTLSGWRDDDLEDFSKSLAELYNDWMATNKSLERHQHDYDMLLYKTSVAEAACVAKQQLVDTCREERDRLRELLGSKREQLRKDFGSGSPAETAAALLEGIHTAGAHCADTAETHAALDRELAALAGQREVLAETRRLQEDHMRELVVTLDHAVARYNLTHSPIQSSELDHIFTDDRDWVLLRQTISECRDARIVAVEQARMAEKRFMDLQRAPERPSADRDEDKQEALARRHTDLVLELEALRGEQADIRRILERHDLNS